MLASCTGRRKPERLLPPEPVVIDNDQAGSKGKALPFWAQTKGDAVHKIGKPYKVNGVWYFPAENPKYDEIGVAATYPESFEGKRTANGEIYSKERLTACHKTLPLPSVVRMTNLENNQSTTVRINDRGPFVNDRLVDVSPKVAEVLQFSPGSNPKVRVEVLSKESKNATELINQTIETTVEPSPEPQPVMESTPTAAEVDEHSPENEEVMNILEATSDMEEPADNAPSTTSEADAPATIEVSQVEAAPEPAPEPTPASTQTRDEGAPVEHHTPPQEVYYVQAGVFGNERNASKLSDKLSDVGAVEKGNITIGDRKLTRVRVGPFTSLGDADRALEQVKSMGVSDARMTSDMKKE